MLIFNSAKGHCCLNVVKILFSGKCMVRRKISQNFRDVLAVSLLVRRL